MDILDFAAAVLIGNLLTVSFVWGIMNSAKAKDMHGESWLVLAALGMPLIFLILSLLASGASTPLLDSAQHLAASATR